MPAISTGTAAITYNSQASTGLLNVSTSSIADMIESQAITSQRRTYIAGQASTTASIEAYYDQADACIAAMETDSVNPVSRTCTITYATGMTISGSAFVTSFQVTGGMSDVLRASIELQFTGTATIA
jgi:hypothetical protein